MKLPPETIIARAKLMEYLLVWKPESDKSTFLAQAGYHRTEAERLELDIRRQLLVLEAEFEEKTDYGDKYQICGSLKGPNGRVLQVVTIWMVETATGKTKFVTLYPKK